MGKERTDIKRAKQTAEILKKYASAKNSADRRVAITKLQNGKVRINNFEGFAKA